MPIKLTKYTLFLALGLLILTNSNVKGQRQSVTPNLLRTGWKATTEIPLKQVQLEAPASTLAIQFAMEFIENGKVQTVMFSQLHGYRRTLKYNGITGREDRVEYEPSILSSVKGQDAGTYSIDSDGIHIIFSELTIDATIGGDQMEGIIRLTKSGEKSKWTAQKVSNDTREESSKIFGTSAPIRQPESISIPTASPEIVKPESFETFLPKQLGNFERAGFDKHIYYTPDESRNKNRDRGDDLKDTIAQFTVGAPWPRGLKDAGKVEIASASYGPVFITITRFEDSAQAANDLQEYLNSVPSKFIVKRENVMNNAKIVGKLVIIQSTKIGDGINEIVECTNDVYRITATSVNLGDAQNLFKLLPLNCKP